MGDILILAHRIPYPPNRGDKIRGFHILKHLSQRKRVHLVAFADDERDMKRKGGLARYTQSRSVIWRSKPQLVAATEALTTHRPVSLTAFDNNALREAVDGVLTRSSIDLIYVFSGQMAQYVPVKPRQKVIMDFVDMDSAKFADYARNSHGPRGWMMQREAKLLANYERSVAQRVDHALFVSEAEATFFRERTGAKNVSVLENGIDTVFYDPSAAFKRIDAMGSLIVFTGQMDYRPNVEGVTWFVEAILPHIRLRHPDARFAIVGRKPTDAVMALARHPGVIVTGEVDDVRSWIAAASIIVAPLKIARGIQNKVLEAMAMAKPVVASTAAAEGIDHAGTLRTGDSVGEIADAVSKLLDDPAGAIALGHQARGHVLARYSWDTCLAPLDAMMGSRRPPERTRTAAA